MSTTDLPLTASERWDEAATNVKKGRGKWVEVEEVGRGGRTNKVKEALERRGITVEVQTRIGNGSEERPWRGFKTWARTI